MDMELKGVRWGGWGDILVEVDAEDECWTWFAMNDMNNIAATSGSKGDLILDGKALMMVYMMMVLSGGGGGEGHGDGSDRWTV